MGVVKPSGHGVQTVLSAGSAYVPAGHSLHGLLASGSPAKPGRHSEQSLALIDTGPGVVAPIGQRSHSVVE